MTTSPQTTPGPIGFIGLGTMGGRMAANLQKAGYQLIVHDARKASAESHLAAGARWVDSPRALAEACDVILLSLPGPPQVESVVTGEDGLIHGMRPGATCIDLTTNSPTMVRKLHGILKERGCHLLDAPISGGVPGAQNARLAIWVGGEKELFDRYKPALDAIGEHVRHIGDIGAGSVAKLVANCSSYAILCSLAEVFSMGVKAGVEPLALWEAVRQGAVGRRRTYDGMIDQFLPGQYDKADFGLPLAHKDVLLSVKLGQEIGVPMRISSLALADLTEALNQGWGEKDSRSVMKLQLDRAGVDIKVDPARIREVLDRDPPAKGDPKAR